MQESESAIPSTDPDTPDYGRLIRRYGGLGLLLTILGGAGGLLSLVVIPPTYQAKTLLEVEMKSDLPQAIRADWKMADPDLATEAEILVSRSMLRRALGVLELERSTRAGNADRQAHDLVSINRAGLEDEKVPRALARAVQTVAADPIDKTQLIEVSCDSPDPQIAAAFLNVLADEYIQQREQARADLARSSLDWVSEELRLTRKQLTESNKRMEDFRRESGNLFVKPGGTLAETKVKELQGRLAAAESDLVPKRARDEMVRQASGGPVPALVDDAESQNLQKRIADLRQEESALLITLQPEHPKVKKVEAEIAEMQTALRKRTGTVGEGITNEYRKALRERDLLNDAYSAAAQQLAGQANKQIRYDALKSESASTQKMYDDLLHNAREAELAASAPVHTIQTIDRAVAPRKPVSPKPLRNIGFGAAGGLGLCFGIAFLIEMMDQRLTSPRDTHQYLSVPSLGAIPSVREARWGDRLAASFLRRLSDGSPATPPAYQNGGGFSGLPATRTGVAESFQLALASLIRASQDPAGLKVVLVTSPGAGEGKTTVASNLGMALAENGRRVLIVDADFRRPRAHVVFGLANRNGLVDLMDDAAPVGEYPAEKLGVPTSVPNLWVLPNGRRADKIMRQIYSARLRQLLRRLREDFDFVLIDSPPILPVADARILGALSDGVVLVLRSGVTDRESAAEAVGWLRADGTHILGTVLNDWKLSRTQAHRYYDYSAPEERNESSATPAKVWNLLEGPGRSG